MPMLPLVAWDRVDDDLADIKLVEWGHWLGACNRPFGRQSFGLWLDGELVSVAVSASTPNAKCGGYNRSEVVELARQCSHPEHRDLTRVCLRLWRVTAPQAWAAQYWPVVAVVTYQNRNRHDGDTYRLDGWTKVEDTEPSEWTGGWNRNRLAVAKSIWVYKLTTEAREQRAREEAQA